MWHYSSCGCVILTIATQESGAVYSGGVFDRQPASAGDQIAKTADHSVAVAVYEALDGGIGELASIDVVDQETRGALGRET